MTPVNLCVCVSSAKELCGYQSGLTTTCLSNAKSCFNERFAALVYVQEMQFQEKKKGEKQKSEYFQTQWRKHVDKLTIPPKQTPVYLAVSKGPSKEKKHRTGEKSVVQN